MGQGQKMLWTVIILLVIGLGGYFSIFHRFTDAEGTSDAVEIGCITPLTGDGATYGEATQRGLAVATDEINAGGGIGGHPVKVICEDDQLNPRVATSAFEKLISIDKVPVVIGAFASSVTLAIAPIAEQRNIVLFSASSTADSIKDAGEYVFRNVPPNRAQGDTAAKFAWKHLGARKAIILEINNDYGLSLSTAFKESFEGLGGGVLSIESYNQGATDFRTILTKIRGLNPDIVFFPGQYQESGLILKQAHELGLHAVFVGGDGSYSPELVKIAGAAADGSYYTLMAVSSSTAANTFEKAYKAKYGSDPDVYSAYAYDALLMIAEAIRKAGYTSSGIKNALYGLTFEGATGTTKFDNNGEVSKPYGVVMVKGGQFVEQAW